MTNREKLRQMTDEELAEWIDKNGRDAPCFIICENNCSNTALDETKPCPAILPWLKAEVTE